MRLDERDAAYLWDMLEAGRDTLDAIEGVSRSQCLTDKLRIRAIERNLEILGEAARGVSKETKEANAEIPWRSLIGQRNIQVRLPR